MANLSNLSSSRLLYFNTDEKTKCSNGSFYWQFEVLLFLEGETGYCAVQKVGVVG